MRNLFRYIKIGSWNLEGAYFKTNNFYTNKLRESEFANILKAHDILCVQETHCGPNDIPSSHFKNYNSIPLCRAKSGNGRYFGGMLLLIKKVIRKGVKVIKTADPDIFGITLKKEFFNLPQDAVVWFVYASPANSPYNKGKENIFHRLELLMTMHGDHQIVMGDLNGRTSNDDDFIQEVYEAHSPLRDIEKYNFDTPTGRNNTDTSPPDAHGKMILNMCKNLQLRIQNGRTSGDRWGVPTRYPVNRKEKPSVIDYGLCSTNLQHKISSFHVMPYTILSDHCCISMNLTTTFCAQLETEDTVKMNVIPIHPRFKLEFAGLFEENLKNDERFSAIQQNQPESTPQTQDHIDKMVENFNQPLLENALKSFPSKNISPRKQKATQVTKPAKWFTNECAKAKNALKRAATAMNKNPFNTNLQQRYVSSKKAYKRTCKKAEVQARTELLDKVLNANDPKEFWNMISDMKGWGREKVDPCDTIPPQDWETHFQNLLNSTATNNSRISAPTVNLSPHMDRKIKMKELDYVIAKSRYGKARGPDGTIAEYIKFAPENVKKALLYIMNAIFNSAIYPTSWSINFLRAIYKSGPTDDPGNYRGLAIGSAIAKLYSSILLNRLESFVTDNNILSMFQIGFRKLFRTADHIYVLKTIINMKLAKGEKLYAAFIDFRKAYDTVNRDKMLKCLQDMGTGNKFTANINAIYRSVKYSIKLKGKVMDPISSNLGLKQGCPLSPLLFNIYINIISEYLNRNTTEPNINLQGVEVTHFLYADDLVIISPTVKGLQEKLNNLGQFARDKDLTINTKKSQVMIFNKGGKLIKEKFSIDGKELEVVPSYTYLGVDIPTNGSFNPGMAQMNSKAKKAMMPLYTTIMQFNIPFRKGLKLFQTFVEPILLYNAENFTTFTEKQIERLKNGTSNVFEAATIANITTTQLKFLKFILGVGKQTPNMAVLGEAATIPLHMRAQISMLKFWNRIRHMNDDVLVKLAYKENVESNSLWCKSIQVLNTSYQLHSRDWTEIEFHNEIKKTLTSSFTNYWRNRIDNRDVEKKLQLYSKAKERFQIGKYLDIPSFRERQIISKFMCSNHTLRIETGRHDNTPREERLCQLCNIEEIEDEDHFIRKCPTYEQIRQEAAINFSNYNNTEAIFHLEEPLKIAEFLRKAYTLRDQLTAPDVYRIKEKSKDGLKLLLCKGKDTPGRLRTQNITKDGLRLKIFRTSSRSPLGSQMT